MQRLTQATPRLPSMLRNWTLIGCGDTDAVPSGLTQTSYADNLGHAIPKAWVNTSETLGYTTTEDPFSESQWELSAVLLV